MEQRRDSDRIGYKLNQTAGLIVAIGTIGAAILFVGSFFFQTAAKAQACEEKFQSQIQRVETVQTETDKTLAELKTDIKYIRIGIEELKRR